MSNKYRYGDDVPSGVLCERLDELATAVTKGKDAVIREFSMRVPAEVDRDADLVLSAASRRIAELEARPPSAPISPVVTDGTAEAGAAVIISLKLLESPRVSEYLEAIKIFQAMIAAAPTQPIDCATKAAAQGIDGAQVEPISEELEECHHCGYDVVMPCDCVVGGSDTPAKPDSPSVMVDREDLALLLRCSEQAHWLNDRTIKDRIEALLAGSE